MPRWLLWALLAVLCWGVWAIVSKLIGGALSPAQSQALSTLGSLPVIAALCLSKRLTASGNRRRGIVLALVAGALVCLGNVAYYHALNLGGKASTVVPLTALYPLVTILLALLLLRERLGSIQIVGLCFSLLAIWLFNVPGVEGWLTGWLAFALVPVAVWGVAGLLQKLSTNEISGELSTLWFLVAFIPVGVVILLLQPLEASVSARVWLLVGLLGFLFALGNFAILNAFASAGKASVVAPLAGLYPVVSVPAAILFLHEKVTAREWLAIFVAIASIIALAIERPGASNLVETPTARGSPVDLHLR
ncbi:MAG: DMT family transporter [Verrucomicrobia subdivision 3 bacterium]|nr:DMT family transporter [Limisphaerales bacterium]